MQKLYMTPKMEIVKFESPDVMTLSVGVTSTGTGSILNLKNATGTSVTGKLHA